MLWLRYDVSERERRFSITVVIFGRFQSTRTSRHNSAIISIIVLIMLAAALSVTGLVCQSPDFFILGSLLGAFATYLVVPLLFQVKK